MLNLGGTYREVKAEDTLTRIQPLLRPIFGITRIANITGLDNLGIYTAVAIRPNGKALSNAQGKGITNTLAIVSALMESIELWHGENLPPAPLWGSYQHLHRHYPLIKIESLQAALYSRTLNTRAQHWVEVQELISQSSYYLPQTLFNQNRVTYGEAFELFWPNSNGLASGNSKEEALCHALFELIERHCAALITTADLPPRQLDIQKIPEGIANDLIECIQQASCELRLFDLNNDLGIPCFYAAIEDNYSLRHVGAFSGYGCHFSEEVALLRAITEAAQSRLTFISGARDDIAPDFYQKKKEDLPARPNGSRRLNNLNTMPATMGGCLDKLLHILYSHGHNQIFAYELTRADLGIPVFHVIIPSMSFNQASHLFRFSARI